MLTTEKVYRIVKNECAGLDSIYEDYIILLVGLYGLLILRGNSLLKTCKVVDGQPTYVLVEKES